MPERGPADAAGPLTLSAGVRRDETVESEAPMGVGQLDDDDYPALTMGQAAQLLDVQPAFLRSLDAAGVLKPQRSSGGHRRYSRRQLRLAARMRELFDQGMTLDAAARIVSPQEPAGHRASELETHDDPPHRS